MFASRTFRQTVCTAFFYDYADPFTRADAGDGTLDSQSFWFSTGSALLYPTWVINSGVAYSTTDPAGAFVFIPFDNATHEVEYIMSGAGGALQQVTAILRMDLGSGDSNYIAMTVGNGTTSGILDGLAHFVVTGLPAVTWANNDVLNFKAVGNVYTMRKNGVTQWSYTDVTNQCRDPQYHIYTGIHFTGTVAQGSGLTSAGMRGVVSNAGGLDDPTPAYTNYYPRGSKRAGVTYSQSSLYSLDSVVAANYTNMNDDSASAASANATATNIAVGSWIQADCGGIQYIHDIVVGYDYLTNLGADNWGWSYTSGLTVQGSVNGSTWTDLTTTPYYTYIDNPAVYLAGTATIPINGSWRYIRLYRSTNSYAVATELQIWSNS
jgi:hypothetical protein